jgi:preprotein translocase subunit SecE
VKDNEYLILGIWVAVIAATFVFLWRKGYLGRLANYVAETREELKKCTWPSWDELKGSTLVVMISIAILGVFTVVVDFIMVTFVQFITKI